MGLAIVMLGALSMVWVVFLAGLFLVPPVMGFVLSLELGGWKAFWIQVGIFILSFTAFPVLFWIWYLVLYVMGVFAFIIFIASFFVSSPSRTQ